MTDPGYIEFLKLRACVFCGAPPNHSRPAPPHHLRHRQLGGNAEPLDETAISTCYRCHGYCHGPGVAWTLERFGMTVIDLVEAVAKQLSDYFGKSGSEAASL